MIKFKNGFTLVELMITVLIVGIMSAYAITSYRSNVIKSNRADAKTKLLEIMQRQERFFSEKNTYTTTLTELGYTFSPALSDNSHYLVTASAPINGLTSGVILTAVPQGKQINDTDCMNFILNSTGQKSVSASATNCW